ncbi:MAG: hypothetical protein EOM64_07590 [Erysipelotrichia bacterium]|nr:hypothetical protein [Erysipelotrichia bacterium]
MKILFVGNSHTYFNDMPHLFSTMMEQGTGSYAEADMLAYSGRDLQWHRQEYFSLRYQLLYGHYDWCIIQQAAHPFPPEEQTFADAKWIIDLCHVLRIKPAVVTTWSKKGQPEIQDQMNAFYRHLTEETDALSVPVGDAWQIVRINHPDIELYWADGAHASPTGDYLTAMVLYGAISGQSNFETLPDAAIDFLGGQKLEFECPSALLSQSDTKINLSEKTRKILIQAAKKALFSIHL